MRTRENSEWKHDEIMLNNFFFIIFQQFFNFLVLKILFFLNGISTNREQIINIVGISLIGSFEDEFIFKHNLNGFSLI